MTKKRDLHDAWLDALLEEELGERGPPDLRHRVLAASAAERGAALDRVRGASANGSGGARRLLGAAAAAVFAAAIVLAVYVRSTAREAEVAPAAGAQGEGAGGQGATREPARPESLEELRGLLSKVTSLAVEVHDKESVSDTSLRSFLIPHGRRVLRDGDELRSWIAALEASLRQEETTDVLKDILEIELHLADGRMHRMELWTGPKPRVVARVKGVGTLTMSPELNELATNEHAAATARSRLRRGVAESLAELERLDASVTHVTAPLRGPDQLDALARFEALRSLELPDGTPVDDGFVRAIAGHAATAGLRALNLPAGRLTDAALAPLGAMRALRELTLRDGAAELSGAGLAPIDGRRLEALRLVRCSGLTAAGVEAVTRFTSLRALAIDRPGGGVVAAMPRLVASFASLEDLRLREAGEIPGDLLDALTRTKLRRLDLSSASAIDVDAFARLAGLPTLHTIVLHGAAVGDELVSELAKFPALDALELTLTKATERAVEKLRAALPRCRVRFEGDWKQGPEGVPVLRDIPVLGPLFEHRGGRR